MRAKRRKPVSLSLIGYRSFLELSPKGPTARATCASSAVSTNSRRAFMAPLKQSHNASHGYRLSVIGYRLSVIGYRSSDIGYRLSVIGHRMSNIGHRRTSSSLLLKKCDFCIRMKPHFLKGVSDAIFTNKDLYQNIGFD